MSSRDIDSTSENVLHDWARDEAPDPNRDEQSELGEEQLVDDGESPEEDGAPAWGIAAGATESVEAAAAVVETEQVEPTVTLIVVAQGTAKPRVKPETVAEPTC